MLRPAEAEQFVNWLLTAALALIELEATVVIGAAPHAHSEPSTTLSLLRPG